MSIDIVGDNAVLYRGRAVGSSHTGDKGFETGINNGNVRMEIECQRTGKRRVGTEIDLCSAVQRH